MYTFNENVAPERHDAFVRQSPLCNLLQSSDWAKVKENWDHAIVGVEDEDGLKASAMVLIKRLPLHFTMMYIPRGPIMDHTDEQLVCFFMSALKRWAKRYHCLFIKMDPGIHYKDYRIEEGDGPIGEDIPLILDNMKKAGAIHQGFTTYIEESIQPRYQANVYACEDFEASLPRHTRRLIKDAVKRDVRVVRAGKEQIQAFSDVVALTEKRKHVSLRNQEYFQQLMDIYGDDCYLFLAEVDIPQTLNRLYAEKQQNDEELASLGDGAPKKKRRLDDIHRALARDISEFRAVCAGISAEDRHRRCPVHPDGRYAGDALCGDERSLQEVHAAVLSLYGDHEACVCRAGCGYANMGGVEGDLSDGLTKFKANFAPYINEFIGEFDLPVNKVLYRFAHSAIRSENAR